MVKILNVATSVPGNRFSQEELLSLLGYKDDLRRSFFMASGIRYRHLSIPKGFRFNETSEEANQRAAEGVIALGAKAVRGCLKSASIRAPQVDFLTTTTSTASLCPNLDIQLIKALKMSPAINRAHIGDVGSAGGVIALKGAYSYLKAFSENRALVVTSEICSACYFRDGALASAVGEAIFADGAACIYVSNRKQDLKKPGFAIVAHHALVRPQYSELMRFNYAQGRRSFELSKEVRRVAAELLADFVKGFLKAQGLKKDEIGFWILHPAGKKIIDNAKVLLGLNEQDLSFTRQVFKQRGNLSASTVFFVLESVLSSKKPRKGDLAMLVGMGPGLGAEGLLLKYC